VSYTTMIDVENSDLALKPGMTATVRIETARNDDTLRVPAAAVRFRPTADVLQAMGHPSDPATTQPARSAGGEARPQTADRSTGGQARRSLGAGDQLRRSLGGGGRGGIWTLVDGRLERVPVEIGVSDGTLVAVKAQRLTEGATVVTGVVVATVASSAPASGSPLVPTPQRRQGR
jgi:HlyD family secretion protein